MAVYSEFVEFKSLNMLARIAQCGVFDGRVFDSNEYEYNNKNNQLTMVLRIEAPCTLFMDAVPNLLKPASITPKTTVLESLNDADIKHFSAYNYDYDAGSHIKVFGHLLKHGFVTKIFNEDGSISVNCIGATVKIKHVDKYVKCKAKFDIKPLAGIVTMKLDGIKFDEDKMIKFKTSDEIEIAARNDMPAHIKATIVSEYRKHMAKRLESLWKQTLKDNRAGSSGLKLGTIYFNTIISDSFDMENVKNIIDDTLLIDIICKKAILKGLMTKIKEAYVLKLIELESLEELQYNTALIVLDESIFKTGDIPIDLTFNVLDHIISED